MELVTPKPETSVAPTPEQADSRLPEPTAASAPGDLNGTAAVAATPPAEVADQALITAAQKGDRAAFAEIVRRHQSSVFGYLRTRVLQTSDAEDLTQEVFLRCYVNQARFDSAAAVRPWLLGIARNLLREHARKVRRRKEVAWTELCLEIDEMVSSDENVYGDMLGYLPGCLSSLGESARQAIELRYSMHLRLSEVGEKLHRSEGAAKLLMFRARQALKNCLDRKFEVDANDG